MSVLYHVCKCKCAHGGQKREMYPLELELQVCMSHSRWVLGTKLQTSVRVASARQAAQAVVAHAFHLSTWKAEAIPLCVCL